MRVLYADENDDSVVLILNKKENDALADIVGLYLKSKPNQRSNAFKLAKALDERLLA